MDRHGLARAMDPPQQQPPTATDHTGADQQVQPPQVQVSVPAGQRKSGRRPNRGAAAAQQQADADALALLIKQRHAAAAAEIQAANAAKRKRSKLVHKRSVRKLQRSAAHAQGEGVEPPRFVVHAAADCVTTDEQVLAQHDAANASTFKSPSRKGRNSEDAEANAVINIIIIS